MQNIVRILLYLDKMVVRAYHVLQLTNNNQSNFKQMSKKHTFHRENCNTCIRMSIVDMLGRTIVLSGTHAFEWQITIVGENSLTVIKFANRVKATKEFNKYRRKR